MTSAKAPAKNSRNTGRRARHWLAQYDIRHAVRRQRRVWSGRASWDQHGSAGLTEVTAAVPGVAAQRA